MARVRSLFDVAGRAARGSGLLAGLLLFPVALDALFVHDLFLGEFALSLEILDGTRLLGKGGVADRAVHKLRLVALVRKSDIPAGAPVYDDLGGAGVLSLCENGPAPNRKNADDKQPDQQLPTLQVSRTFR